MVKAYVLIEMLAGHSKNLVDSLRDRKVVSSVDRVTGPYDVIAVVNAENINEISNIVSSEVHTHSGVVRTTTCVSLE